MFTTWNQLFCHWCYASVATGDIIRAMKAHNFPLPLLSDQRTNFDIVHSVLMLYGPLSCWTTSFWPSEGLYIGSIKTLFSRRCRQCRLLSLFEHNSSCLRSDRIVFVVHWTKTRTITVSYLVFRFGHMNYSIRLCVWLLWRCALVTARGRAVSVAAAAVSRSALAARVRL